MVNDVFRVQSEKGNWNVIQVYWQNFGTEKNMIHLCHTWTRRSHLICLLTHVALAVLATDMLMSEVFGFRMGWHTQMTKCHDIYYICPTILETPQEPQLCI